jgi:hypothetical protein
MGLERQGLLFGGDVADKGRVAMVHHIELAMRAYGAKQVAFHLERSLVWACLMELEQYPMGYGLLSKLAGLMNLWIVLIWNPL